MQASKPICPNHRCVWNAPPRPRSPVAPATQRSGGGGGGGSGGGNSGGRSTLANCDILASCDHAHVSCDLSHQLLLEAISLRGVAAKGPRAEREGDERRAEPMSKTRLAEADHT